MLPDGPDVAFVLEGERGVFETMAAGTIVVDSSTIAPRGGRASAAETARRGGSFLDAPASSGEIGAVTGTLAFMVGGGLPDPNIRSYGTPPMPVCNQLTGPDR